MWEKYTGGHPDETLLDVFFYAYDELASGILICDLNCRIVFANHQFLHSLNFDESEKENQELLHAVLDDDIRILLEKILDNRMPDAGVEVQWAKNDIDKKHFLVTGKLLTLRENPYIILTITDITAHKIREQHLLYKLEFDFSTEVLNKYGLFKYMHQLTNTREKRSFTICMLDFDSFKSINDNCGHIMGDEVLKIFSNIARSNIRTGDVIGRYGGEEFIFIFLDVEIEKAAEIISRIQFEVKNYFENFLPYEVSFSAGMFYIDQAKEPESNYLDLIYKADQLLYEAKVRGKRRIVTPAHEYCLL